MMDYLREFVDSSFEYEHSRHGDASEDDGGGNTLEEAYKRYEALQSSVAEFLQNRFLLSNFISIVLKMVNIDFCVSMKCK